jgi:rubrerythrin
MSVTFDASDILEIAIEIEKNGEKFYKKAAGIVKDSRTKQFLIELADMEKEHEETFRQMMETLPESETKVLDPDNEASLYLQAMADGNVFDVKKDISNMLAGKETAEQIFKIAIQAEKDSIIYYIGLEDFLPDEEDKKRVDKIIEEERSHILALYQQLKEIG